MIERVRWAWNNLDRDTQETIRDFTVLFGACFAILCALVFLIIAIAALFVFGYPFFGVLLIIVSISALIAFCILMSN